MILYSRKNTAKTLTNNKASQHTTRPEKYHRTWYSKKKKEYTQPI